MMRAFVIAIAALAFVSTIAFTIDRGPSYVQAPSAGMLAAISEDAIQPLTTTGSSVIDTITDASFAIASDIATDDGMLTTTSGLFLLAAIAVLYLSKIDTGRLRHLRRVCVLTARTLVKYMTFLRSHGGAAHASSIA